MALQIPATPATNTAWLKSPAVKIVSVFVAGLFAIVTLLFNPFTNSKSETARSNFSQNKQAAVGGTRCAGQKKQTTGSSSFSLMPGRLNRFLQ